nr:PREDICTED: uncharacterized protein LOC105676962 [Linepithema humile]
MSCDKVVRSNKTVVKHYIIKKNFRVQCRVPSCKTIYKYVRFIKNNKFTNHVLRKHLEFYEFEENQKTNINWRYYRLTKKKEEECILCDMTLNNLNESTSEHIKKHSKEEKSLGRHKFEDWSWKYLKQVEDSTAKCRLCTQSKNFNLYIEIQNLKKHVENTHQKKWQKVKPSYKQSWEHQIKKFHFLNIYYNKPVNFKTKCRFCSKYLTCITAHSLKQHIKEHKWICKIEDLKKPAPFNKNLKYFRLISPTNKEMECVLCTQSVSNQTKQMNNHIINHSPEKLKLFKFNNWVFKYARQETEIVKCIICAENISIHFHMQNLRKHIKNKHSADKILQKDLDQGTAHDQAGPSTSYAS